jgi:hypothetical protein
MLEHAAKTPASVANNRIRNIARLMTAPPEK